MAQESPLGSLPSFSRSAFAETNPQLQYKQVRRIKPRGAKNDKLSDPAATEECRPIMTRQPTFPNAKDIMLIDGVDPDCKISIYTLLEVKSLPADTNLQPLETKFRSTDIPLPFLYDDNFGISTPATIKPAPWEPQSVRATVSESSSSTKEPRERKRPKRDSERRVEVELTVQSERKRPKREAERRAEALAKQEKR